MVYAVNGRVTYSSNDLLEGMLIKVYDIRPFYGDLHVMDGSVSLDPIGVNPSLIISALASRTAAYMKNKE
jgi:hypothetical protein